MKLPETLVSKINTHYAHSRTPIANDGELLGHTTLLPLSKDQEAYALKAAPDELISEILDEQPRFSEGGSVYLHSDFTTDDGFGLYAGMRALVRIDARPSKLYTKPGTPIAAKDMRSFHAFSGLTINDKYDGKDA